MGKSEKSFSFKINILPKGGGYIVDIDGDKFAKESVETLERLIKATVWSELSDKLFTGTAGEYDLICSITEK